MSPQKEVNAARWREAAVFGALWGALEVTLGVFLHSLRLPFAGLCLTACGTAVMVAAKQIFPARGLALRAALVCAVLKAFSPGGVIFGPMCAILGEGLVIELAYGLLKRPLPSALLAGLLASLWTIVQFVVIRLALYGASILELYGALLQRAAKTCGLPESWGWPALLGFVALLALLGAIAGDVGRRLGRAALARRSALTTASAVTAPAVPTPAVERAAEAAVEPAKGGCRLGLIALAMVALSAQICGHVLWALGGLVVLFVAAFIWDRGALRFLGRAYFWVLSLLLGGLAGLFLGEHPVSFYGVRISVEGLLAGAQMVIRSAVLLLSMALLARTIPRKRFLALAERVGLQALAPAVESAVALLPGLQASFGRLKPHGFHLKSMFRVLVGILDETARLAEPSKTRCFAVTGRPGAGKTQFLQALAVKARARSVALGGFVQPRMPQAGARDGYRVEAVASQRSVCLAHFETDHFVFEQAGFDWAAAALATSSEAALLLVDELGHQEAAGKGHWPALAEALEKREQPLVLCCAVAKKRLSEIEARLQGFEAVLDLDEAGDQAAIDAFEARLWAVLEGRDVDQLRVASRL